MLQSNLPVALRDDEILLQWYAPNAWTRIGIAARRSRLWVVLGMVGATFVSLPLMLVLGMVHELLAAVGLGVVFASLMAGWMAPVVFQVVFRAPVRWWVTSQRLVLGGSKPRTIPLDTVSDIDVTSAHEVTLTADGESIRLRPVAAMPELWGALVLGRALALVPFPPVDAEAPEPLMTGTVCWNGVARQGSAQTTGVMVFRPDRVVWVPATTVTLGDRAAELGSALAGAVVGMRVRTIRPLIPTDPLFHRLIRIADPGAFDDVLSAVVRSWGGFVATQPALTLHAGAGGEDVTLNRNGVSYEAKNVAHPDWQAVRGQLVEGVGRAPRQRSA